MSGCHLGHLQLSVRRISALLLLHVSTQRTNIIKYHKLLIDVYLVMINPSWVPDVKFTNQGMVKINNTGIQAKTVEMANCCQDSGFYLQLARMAGL